MPTAVPTARIITVADAVVTAINTLDIGSIQTGAAAIRGYSFGYTDSELSKLKVVVRPADFMGEGGNAYETDVIYKLQIGVLKMVQKLSSASPHPTDGCLNLACAIARMFAVPNTVTVGSDRLEVVANRPMPLFRIDSDAMDNIEASVVRFDYRLEIDLKELGRAKSELT